MSSFKRFIMAFKKFPRAEDVRTNCPVCYSRFTVERYSDMTFECTFACKRLIKELRSFADEPPEGMYYVDRKETEKNLLCWTVYMTGDEDSLFEGEKFQLQFKFDDMYPYEPPKVTFVGDNIPVHPQVYSNGHVCTTFLGDDWSPSMTVMIISNRVKRDLPSVNLLYYTLVRRRQKYLCSVLLRILEHFDKSNSIVARQQKDLKMTYMLNLEKKDLKSTKLDFNEKEL